VNESYDHLILKSNPDFNASNIQNLKILPDIPIISEFFASGLMVDYTSIERQFMEDNMHVLETLKARVDDLTRKSLQKDIEVYTVLNKSPKK
jgi:hypothetical protein